MAGAQCREEASRRQLFRPRQGQDLETREPVRREVFVSPCQEDGDGILNSRGVAKRASPHCLAAWPEAIQCLPIPSLQWPNWCLVVKSLPFNIKINKVVACCFKSIHVSMSSFSCKSWSVQQSVCLATHTALDWSSALYAGSPLNTELSSRSQLW